MKYFALLLSLSAILMTSACADHSTSKKSGWFFGLLPPQQWPEHHWEYAGRKNQIRGDNEILTEALDRDRSMFDEGDLDGVSPEEFVQNLKNADIIQKVYRTKSGLLYDLTGSILYEGFQTGTKTYDVIQRKTLMVAVDYNFYTLTLADQVVISELLLQSYGEDILYYEDTHTDKIVGHATPEGFDLF